MSTHAVERKLHIEHRVAEQQARATIKDNPVLALVELLTNSDDSYRRLESAGFKADGRIIIELIRKYEGSVIRVIDYAEGFNAETMDERVGGYGGDTSGFTEKDAGRGYWGRGLKEAMIAMGFGSVESVRDNSFHKCTLENLDYKRNYPVKVTKQMRNDIGLPENGTFVTLKVIHKGIRIPQFENLKNSLEYYYSLRDIMGNNSRNVVLIEKDSRNKIKRQEQLFHIPPKGDLFYRDTITVPDFENAKIDLEIYRATEPLSGHDEEGPLRENGVLIRSKGAILDITLTRKFEGNSYASRIFGHATCDHIDHLMRVDKEPVVHANRSGLDWSHPFCKALDSAISKEIANFVREEEKRAKETERKLENDRTRKRYEASLPELNKIAKEELGPGGGPGDGPDDGPGSIKLPPNGFDFMPDYVQIVVDKDSTLTLKALVPKVIPSGAVATIKSDVKEILIKEGKVVFDEKDADSENGLVTAHVKIVGKQVGVEGVISAEVKGIKAEILVKVISKKVVPPPRPPKGGLFKNFEFSAAADPHQRVKFDRNNGKVVIATRSPSVEIYFGLDGEGQDEGHCQVMLAELVIEAVCREIARRKVESGKEPFLGEASEAMNVVHNRLINKYAAKIHNLLVDKKFRRAI